MSGHEALRAFATVASPHSGDGDAHTLRQDVARAFAALMAGDGAAVEEAAHGLHTRALGLGAGAEVIEAAVVRALAALTRGDLSAATELARRAARMAQTEGLPEQECLAHLALARIRRHGGRPHLATHILSALATVAPVPWHGWLAWELLLAGGERRASALLSSGDSPSIRAARALEGALAAARSGDRSVFTASIEAAIDAACDWTDVRREAEALAAGIDHTREPPSEEVARWRRGEGAQTPSGLHGVGAPQTLDIEGDVNVAFVIALPGAAGRRVLPPGLGLTPAMRRLDQEATGGTSGGRADLGLAVLALTGPSGLPRADFFQTVYGFGFARGLHQDALDVLIHRMRQRLGDSGEILRGGEEMTISLALREPLIVPDVRCALPLAERVLRALALLTRASAQEAAAMLGLAVRTVQKALQELVADGSCVSERIGQQVSYRLHDTTFTEVGPLAGRGTQRP